MHEVTCGLFNAFIINVLNLDIRKDITIFDEIIIIKGNGVRGAREAWNAGGSVAGRDAGVRVHYYDVIKGEYLLGDGSPVRIVNTETHKCDKHYMAHVVCLDKNAALFNVGSRVDMDGNILSHGRASEDLELQCKDMTNAKAFEKEVIRAGANG